MDFNPKQGSSDDSYDNYQHEDSLYEDPYLDNYSDSNSYDESNYQPDIYQDGEYQDEFVDDSVPQEFETAQFGTGMISFDDPYNDAYWPKDSDDKSFEDYPKVVDEESDKLPWRKTKAAKALLITLSLLLATVVAVAAAYVGRMNKALDDIQRHEWTTQDSSDNGAKGPMTILLVGADKRGADAGRSDSLILAYLPADRKHVYLISLPRDAYVEVPGYGRTKINAAFSYGGVPLTIKTVENLLDIHVQHAAVINLENFIRLTDVLGGITVYNEEASNFKGFDYPEGDITLNGEQALWYVRERKSLSQGDLTRAKRQRSVLKGIFKKSLSLGVLANPAKFSELLDQTSKLIDVDSNLTSDVIRDTAFQLAGLNADDIRGLQLPLSGFDNIQGAGSVDLVDKIRLEELQKALKTDTVDSYYDNHKNDNLVGGGQADVGNGVSVSNNQGSYTKPATGATTRTTTATKTTIAQRTTATTRPSAVTTTKPAATTTKVVTQPTKAVTTKVTTQAPQPTDPPKTQAPPTSAPTKNPGDEDD